jgi:carbamoyltransferase
MITWGAVGNSHDASLAVFNYGDLVWAGLAKDFSGIPNDPHLNKGIIDYATSRWGYPSNIHWYERPILKTARQLWAGQGWLLKENNIEKYFKDRGIRGANLFYTKHHHSHAAYAYYTQPHDDCAVICLDSIGEFETLTIWHGKNGKLKKIYSQGYPHSPGLFYSAMTQRLGLVPQRDEYMVADMGAESDPKHFKNLMLTDIVEKMPDLVDPSWKFKENLHRGCRWWKPEINSEEDLRMLAATTQHVFEEALANLSAWARYSTGAKHLALAGGGALNRSAVHKIKPQWSSVHVPKNPGDPGSCIGAVLAFYEQFENIDKVWHS